MSRPVRVFWNWLRFRPILHGGVLLGVVWAASWVGLEVAVTLTPLPQGLDKSVQVSPLINDRSGRPLRLQRVAGE